MYIDQNHGQVAESIENYYGGGVSLPPEGHPNSRVCPQCDRLTWRMTQHCLCCGVDLFAVDQHERWRAIERRKMKFAVVFGLLALAAIFGGYLLPGQLRGWSAGIGILAGLFALGAAK